MGKSYQLIPVEITGGLNKDDSPTAGEGTWNDLQWARMRRGRLEVEGGYSRIHPTATFTGYCRGAAAWADLNGGEVLGFGTDSKLYAYLGEMYDVTPYHSEFFLSSPFDTVNASTAVTVTNKFYDADSAVTTEIAHNLQVGDAVSFVGAAAVGGLTISGAYTVTTVVSETKYTITAASAATSTATAGGGYVLCRVTLRAGLADGLGGLGYGVATYGDGDYSLSSTVDFLPRVWSIDHFGENMVAVPRDGGVYEWQPESIWPEINTGTFTLGTGWTGTTTLTATAGTASDASQSAANGVLEPGRIYRLSFTLTRTAGTVKFMGDAINLSPDLSVAGTYAFNFQAPPTPALWKFTKDATFAGTISNISLKLAATAYRVDEAPHRNHVMFVDPNAIVCVGGTYDLTGVYDPCLIRTSAQQNLRSWVPDNNNTASYYRLSAGGRIVGGIPTRLQNLWSTDAGVYSQQFTGQVGSPYAYRLLGSGCAWAGRNAAVEQNGVVYWMSAAGQFFQFRGAVPEQIDCPVRDEVFDNLDKAQMEKVYGYVSSAFNEVVWLLPDSRTGLECSREVRFNFVENHWYVGTIDRTAGVSPGVYANPILFGTDGRIYTHETGATFAGGSLSWSASTGRFKIAQGDTLMQVMGYKPDFKGLQGTITLNIDFWDSPQQATPRTVGPFTITSATENVWFRATGRYGRLRYAGSGTPCAGRFGVQAFYAGKSGAYR